MTAIEKVLSVARAEVGYMEKQSLADLYDKTANAGRGNWTKYAYELDQTELYNGKKNGFDWCDMFFDWVLMTALGFENMVNVTYQRLHGAGAGCTYSMGWYKQNHALFDYPEVGDQIFFSRDDWDTSYHTGLVVDVRGGRVYTIEGNTSNTASVVANGGCVAEKSYPISYGKYGRPNYSLVEEEEDMNVERFKELWLEMRKELQDNDAGQWSDEARDWAISTGLFNGSGTTPSGEPNYMFADVVTREQLITVLYRFAKMFGKV